MFSLLNSLYHNAIASHIFPTTVFCLKRELKNCESVLDIGCGPSSPLKYCENIKYSVGVEPYPSYLKEARRGKTHSEYIGERIEELDFEEKSFDAVILIEVIEHLPQEQALETLKRAEKWARKKVVVTTPNGFVPQGESDGNPLQRHLSGWGLKELESLGYRCQGLSGLKILRGENQGGSMVEGNLTSSIRFRPKIFWFAVATFSQAVVYYIPKLAFELFCVKDVS